MLTLLSALLLVQTPQPAVPAPPLPAAAAFAAADVAARRSIMKDVDVRADTAPETTFDLIAAGLRDPDAPVREDAAGALRTLRAAVGRSRLDPRIGRQVALPAEFLDALSVALDSSDLVVRLQSMDGLVAFEPNSERTKTRLLDRYTREDAPLLRAQLLMHLRAIAPDDAAVRRVVLAAVEDPAAPVRYQGVLGVAVWAPDTLLSRAGRGLDDPDSSMRLAWADALAAYGSRATPYLEQMRQLLAAETNARDRQRLQAAITTIRPASR